MGASTTAHAMEKIGDLEVWLKPHRVAGDWDEWDVRLANTHRVVGSVIRRGGGGFLASLPWRRDVWNIGRKEWDVIKGTATGKGNTIADALKAAKKAADEATKG